MARGASVADFPTNRDDLVCLRVDHNSSIGHRPTLRSVPWTQSVFSVFERSSAGTWPGPGQACPLLRTMTPPVRNQFANSSSSHDGTPFGPCLAAHRAQARRACVGREYRPAHPVPQDRSPGSARFEGRANTASDSDDSAARTHMPRNRCEDKPVAQRRQGVHSARESPHSAEAAARWPPMPPHHPRGHSAWR